MEAFSDGGKLAKFTGRNHTQRGSNKIRVDQYSLVTDYSYHTCVYQKMAGLRCHRNREWRWMEKFDSVPKISYCAVRESRRSQEIEPCMQYNRG